MLGYERSGTRMPIWTGRVGSCVWSYHSGKPSSIEWTGFVDFLRTQHTGAAPPAAGLTVKTPSTHDQRSSCSASEKMNLARLYEGGFGARNELTRSDALRAEFEPQGPAAIGKFERQTRRRSFVS